MSTEMGGLGLRRRISPFLAVSRSVGLAAALACVGAPEASAQDSSVMQEIDRQQEQLLRALQERQRRLDDRRSDQRTLDRREDMRREEMDRDDVRRDEAREAERRRQIDEDERRERDRRR